MASLITQEDLSLVLRHSVDTRLKVEVLDDLSQKLIGTLYGVVSGSMSIDGSSDVRRTCNFVLQPTRAENLKLSENEMIWMNKDVRLSFGLYNFRTKQYKYYPLGTYVYTDTSATYDSTNNQLTVNCADFMKKLDGTKNGQMGALKILYPAYEENPDTGEVVQYNIIRDAIVETLETLARIKKYRIDDVGEYYALPENNKDWKEYREKNDTWNCIPFDQEFSVGCSVLSILTTFRDLYPSYEMFFDIEDNAFICQMVPTCYEDDTFLDNDFLQKALVSESSSIDMTTVRNICEVWGEVIETDYYADSSTYSDGVYSATISGYEEKYYNGDTIAIRIQSANLNNSKININGFGNIGIYDEATEEPILANRLKANMVYSFKIKIKKGETKAFLLGQWQVHAMDVLTDGTTSNEIMTDSDGKQYQLYSLEYFKKWYNCENVNFTIIPDSPFTIQKLGEINDVKSSGEFENITSDDLALDRAHWENWKNSRLTDNITINTILLPFLDVNKKVSYQPKGSDKVQQYIISSVSHDFSSFTSSITMYKFYPLYIPNDYGSEIGTHNILSMYTNIDLSKYYYEQLIKLGSKGSD